MSDKSSSSSTSSLSDHDHDQQQENTSNSTTEHEQQRQRQRQERHQDPNENQEQQQQQHQSSTSYPTTLTSSSDDDDIPTSPMDFGPASDMFQSLMSNFFSSRTNSNNTNNSQSSTSSRRVPQMTDNDSLLRNMTLSNANSLDRRNVGRTSTQINSNNNNNNNNNNNPLLSALERFTSDETMMRATSSGASSNSGTSTQQQQRQQSAQLMQEMLSNTLNSLATNSTNQRRNSNMMNNNNDDDDADHTSHHQRNEQDPEVQRQLLEQISMMNMRNGGAVGGRPNSWSQDDTYVPPPRSTPWPHPHVWSCLLVAPSQWEAYSPENQMMIDAAFNEEENTQANIQVEGVDFQIKFDEMVQVNHDTGSKRRVVKLDAQDASMIPFVTDTKQLLEISRQLGDFSCPLAGAVDGRLCRLLNKAKYMQREDAERLPTVKVKEAIASGAIEKDWYCGVCLQLLASSEKPEEDESVLTMLPECLHFYHQECAVEYFAHLSWNCCICNRGVSAPPPKE